ncbi:hypothetical protein VCR14J2_260081 [Vibrio coralliirubri]|nr:hypothetical protein VCR14J2_260081 [Vibrio coralliirubri]
MECKKTGVKKPFRLEEIWRIRTRLELSNNLMELSLLNLAIDSKLRSNDLLSLRVSDVSSNFLVFNRVNMFRKRQAMTFSLKSLREHSKR